jgi:hypothetical protein
MISNCTFSNRPLIRIAALVSGALLVVSMSTTSANAAGTASKTVKGVVAQQAACELEIGSTFREGNHIKGFGSLATQCHAFESASLWIERLRWNGWEKLTRADVSGPGYDQYVTYNCTNTGTHTFRTIIEADTLGGRYLVKASNSIREYC